MAGSHVLADRARIGAEAAFLASVVLLPLQWWPRIPLAGAQLSDFGFLLAALALLATAPPILRLRRIDLGLLALFALGAACSAVWNSGSYVKLIGHFELVVIAATAAVLALDPDRALRIRQALVVAALLAAVIGLIGAGLYYAGHRTGLLNPHYGDLVPGNYPRIRATCIRANMLASVLATGLVLGLGEAKESALGRHRWLIAGVLLVALVFTISRTWLTVAVGIGFAVAMSRHSRAGLILAGSAAAVVVGLMVVSARYDIQLDPTRFWDATIGSQPGTRWIHWGDALDTIASSPLFGVGPGAPATFDGWSAHLAWLNLWAVLGILPLLALATLVGRGLTLVRRELWLVTALGVMVLDSLGRDIEDMRHLWLVVGLLLAARAGGSRPVSDHATTSSGQTKQSGGE